MGWTLLFLCEAITAFAAFIFKAIAGTSVAPSILVILAILSLFKVAAGHHVRSRDLAAGGLLVAVAALDIFSAGVLYAVNNEGWEYMGVVIIQAAGSGLVLLIAFLVTHLRPRPPTDR